MLGRTSTCLHLIWEFDDKDLRNLMFCLISMSLGWLRSCLKSKWKVPLRWCYLKLMVIIARFVNLIDKLVTFCADIRKIWDEVFSSEATPIEYAEILDNLQSKFGLGQWHLPLYVLIFFFPRWILSLPQLSSLVNYYAIEMFEHYWRSTWSIFKR